MSSLNGKVAIVTGATKGKGLGKAIAVKLSEQGAKVVLTGRASSEEGVKANVEEIKAAGGEAMYVLVDVSNQDEIDAALAEVAGRHAPRVLLADEVGLGKTIEAGMIIQNQLLTGREYRAAILIGIATTQSCRADALVVTRAMRATTRSTDRFIRHSGRPRQHTANLLSCTLMHGLQGGGS